MKSYDYVGAPWISADWLADKKRKIMKESFLSKPFLNSIVLKICWLFKGYYSKKSLNVGNGGFSLRKIDSFLNISSQDKTVLSWSDNEDVFWSIYVPLNYDFRIPTFKKAAEFSFDLYPNELFKLVKHKLPLGCHAWYRKDFPYEGNTKFWGKFINAK